MTAQERLQDLMRHTEDREIIAVLHAAIDLIESIEIDEAAGEDEDARSWPVIGNVDTSTLLTLGLITEKEVARERRQAAKRKARV